MRKNNAMIFNLSGENTIANEFLLELRHKTIQKDRMRFRRNVERLGEIMAYEISKTMVYESVVVETVLGTTQIPILVKQPLLLTILRAGLPFAQGLLNFFDKADTGFIGAYRQENGPDLTIKLDYVATPDIQDTELILIDPMLATGRSAIDAIHAVMKKGTPSHVHVVSLIAAPEGIERIKQNLTLPFSLWTCAIDENLNNQFYIVPGLGDAGDLSFGTKV